MIPYIQIPSLFGVIHAFGVLVAIGIIVGVRFVRQRAAQLGLDDAAAQSVSTWVVVMGFIVAHLIAVFAYQPDAVARQWSTLTAAFSQEDFLGWLGATGRFLWFIFVPVSIARCGLEGGGISSFGGFLGALIGLVWWSRRYRQPMLPYADALLYGLAPGWLFGRLGCFTAHDHPGRLTDFFLAVQYPNGARHDLGLYDAIFAASLTGLYYFLSRKPRRIGTYVTLGAILYAPVRFGLDFLRAVDVPQPDARYFGLTPAQYGTIALFFAGLALAWVTRNQPTRVAEPPPPLEEAPPPSPSVEAPPARAARRRRR